MHNNKAKKKRQEENAFLQSFIRGLEDIEKGRVSPLTIPKEYQ